MFFLDVFPAALFVHEFDRHELFGVHIVVWDNNSCCFLTNFIVNNIMTVGAISMSMCIRYQIGPVGVLMVLGVPFCIGGNFLTGVRCC